MSERSRPLHPTGALGVSLFAVVVVAGSTAALLRQAQVPQAIEAPAPLVAAVDTSAAEAAINELDTAISRGSAAAVLQQQQLRAVERSDRLRQLAHVVAKARDLRRAQGQTGMQLRGPFLVAELGDLAWLEAGDTRWLLSRAGRPLAPTSASGLTSELQARLANVGREEDALTVEATIDGRPSKLSRRCLPAENYCIVDVEAQSVAPSIDLAPLRQHIAALSKQAPSLSAASSSSASSSSAPSSSSSSSAPSSSALLALLALLAGLALGVVTLHLLQVSHAAAAAALRLRAGLAGRALPPGAPVSREIAGLDRAIDDAVASLGLQAGCATIDDNRRARWSAVAELLDSARTRGGLERLAVADSDDVVTARLVHSTNSLLEALDERGRRFKALLDDATGSRSVLPSLARRLLRLARVDGLSQPLVDELTSLGNALAARIDSDTALEALQGEVNRVTPAAGSLAERLATMAALREMSGVDIVRLTASKVALVHPVPESPPQPPRPTE